MNKYADLIGDEHTLPAITGRAWVVGDHVRAAQILPPEHAHLPAEQTRAFLFRTIDPTLAANFTAGDFIVAGLDFATDDIEGVIPAALNGLGVAAVIARSFGASVARQALELGLAVLQVEETGAIKTGDRLRVDVEAHVVANLSSGDRYVVRNLDDAALAMLRVGGNGQPPRR